jgi:hypothetical protein
MVTIAVVIVCARVAFRLLGMDEHAAVVAGMPLSNASWGLGPIAVVLSLASVIVAPILVLGAALMGVVRLMHSSGEHANSTRPQRLGGRAPLSRDTPDRVRCDG